MNLSLTTTLHGAVAILTLNRPDAGNALNLELATALNEASIWCDENPGIRAVLLRANGKAFCVGGDLQLVGQVPDQAGGHLKRLTTQLHAALSRFARLRAPVVAEVQGVAAGAGMSLSLAADVVLMSDEASFVPAYTGVGLSPDGSMTFHLPRLVGPRLARQWMISNTRITAAMALDHGLVSEVHSAQELSAQALQKAMSLAEGPTLAYQCIKRLVMDSPSNTLETHLELEARAIADCANSQDGREGLNAFLSRRKPTFLGH